MSRHTEIPAFVYDTLRNINASRVRRHDDELAIPNFTNHQIFLMMPDHEDLVWTAPAQPAITSATLATMFAHSAEGLYRNERL
jgi:hypothetical protein